MSNLSTILNQCTECDYSTFSISKYVNHIRTQHKALAEFLEDKEENKMSKIRIEYGRTLNTGNYENVKLTFGIEIVVESDDVFDIKKEFDDWYERLKNAVSQKLDGE